MANFYVRSADGNDGDSGATWALAKATLAGAFTAASAGDTIYVADGHAETQASAMTLTSPGTSASPVRVLCVDDTGDPEPPTALATTATVTTTGNSSMSFGGVAYSVGVSYSAGTGANGARASFENSGSNWMIENGNLSQLSTGAGALGLGGGFAQLQRLSLRNVSLKFGAVSQTINVNGVYFEWIGGSIDSSGSAPTTLLTPLTRGAIVRINGVNLSHIGSGNSLVSVANTLICPVLIENCKLGSSVSVTTGTHPGFGGPEVRLVNSDSGDTNYRYQFSNYPGTITQETTIVRTGGASDGTTSISRKMVTTANSKFYAPLVSDPIIVWNETTGSSVTATVEVVTDNVTLTDAEAWIEVEYLGTSGFPVSSFASDRASNILSTPANQTTSSETWTTTGLTTPVKQALAVSFTPQEKGPLAIRVHLAKASTTMYFCPKATIT